MSGTFEVPDLPNIRGGTWKIFNATDEDSVFPRYFVRLCVDGYEMIESPVRELNLTQIGDAVKHLVNVHEGRQVVPGLTPNNEVTLINKPKEKEEIIDSTLDKTPEA